MKIEKTKDGEIIIGPIDDLRLTPGLYRSRSGSTQQFGDRIVRGGKVIQECDFSLTPPEKHLYALEISGVWLWVNGCVHCNDNGDKMSYQFCEEHDRCQGCNKKRADCTGIPPRNEHDHGGGMWGSHDDCGVWGWTCHPCHERQEAITREAALSRILPDDEFDENDYEYEDEAKCPYCNAEVCTDESYDADGEELECGECGHAFTLTANHSVTWSTSRIAPVKEQPHD
ncbi:hypothetical protein [Ewingella americana]|uniref:Uncharacterized protein n=2 Tax=Ewingella americana TaxID=41202 RepID=A0A085G133_EWIA3|nr:hypothetical protein [Ewingella americana]KAA8726714.1 hypothetical protein F4W05_17775 [Ewingella americana]KFC77428.1 hypothetical protein GEAM_4279 [Ewingella americana ATCC 33852]STS10379.1 Uncharacterised protein [Ewingella americana]